MLRLILSLSRFYTAAAMSLPQTRALDAARMLTLAAMAAMTTAAASTATKMLVLTAMPPLAMPLKYLTRLT